MSNIKTVEAARACKVCGAEKPIKEFKLTGRWYRHICKRCYNSKYRDWYRERDRLLRVRNMKLYGFTNAPRERERNRLYESTRRTKLRQQAISTLGDRCECCGESDPRLLTIGHISGVKTGSRYEGNKLFLATIAAGYPNSRYRLLCWNCNISLSLFGHCPHQGRPPEEGPVSSTQNMRKWQRQHRKKLKVEAFDDYGGKCLTCGEDRIEFLVIDHINGGGIRHRKELGIHGSRFYGWLKKRGFPKDEYRLLCFDCNYLMSTVRVAAGVTSAEMGKENSLIFCQRPKCGLRRTDLIVETGLVTPPDNKNGVSILKMNHPRHPVF